MFTPGSMRQIRSLSRQFDLAQADTLQKTRTAVRKHALNVERGAKTRAPVDTGALRNSINTTTTGMSGNDFTGPIGAVVGPEVRYGVFVELGTARMAPQPYLGPAFDEVEPTFVSALDAIAGQIGR